MIRIGVSGWQYREFRGSFYPEKLSAAKWFAEYARRFDTVEINSSFYGEPRESTWEKWREQAPPGFLYAVKANRYFTHFARLKDAGERLESFLAGASILGPRLGPVLFQTPETLKPDLVRLRAFLGRLRELPLRFALELRDPGWHIPAVYRELERAGVAFCAFDIRGYSSPTPLTADFAYVRLHGPHAIPYLGSYSRNTLEEWARRIKRWERACADIYFYFDNTTAADAPLNALELRELLGLAPAQAA